MLHLRYVMSAAALGVAAALLNPVSAADAVQKPVWTLETSARRALDVAPELRQAEAQVAAREGEYRQADAWPNPTLELRADDKLGIEDGSGGTDLTHVGISQPLPLRRLARARAVAAANLEAARENRRYEHLRLENQTAHAYHKLQLAAARLKLAEEKQQQVSGLAETPRGRDPLVRYLAPTERLRLDILREEAQQAIAFAEGEHSEAASHFRALLALLPEAELALTELAPVAPPPPLASLEHGLESHPALNSARKEQEAARAGIEAARASRFNDPALTFFRERDFIGGGRRDVNGVGLSIQIPLWNLNTGGIGKAYAEADQAQARQATRRRDLTSRLRTSHTHLGHLIEQAEHFRVRILDPGKRLFDLTRRGFSAGEAGILALVDASNTYFDARWRYLELLAQSWIEAADVRLAAGRSALDTSAEGAP
ncbi:MAG: TolC family protein [Pseudomonadota bacterium]